MLFAFHAFDKPNALALRQQTRPAHLEHLANIPVGLRLVAASPLINDTQQMVGSLLVIEAEERERVEAFIAADPYSQADLFASTSLHVVMDTFIK